MEHAVFYREDTWTGTIGIRLFTHNVCWKQRILKFCFFILHLGTNKIQVFNYATIEHYKTLWTHLTSQEKALKFMNVIGSFAKKTWESFIFRKWCDCTIFSQVSRVECPHCKIKFISFFYLFPFIDFSCLCIADPQCTKTKHYIYTFTKTKKIAHNLCTKIQKMSHLDSSSVKSSFSASITVACNENTLLNI